MPYIRYVMKEKIQLPRKYNVLLIVVFITIVIGAVIFFTRNYLSHKDEFNSLIAKEIKGRIVVLKDEHRGSYYIEIKNQNDTFKISAPIAWEVKKYNIQMGDSINKNANSKIIFFYKLKRGVFERYCDYEMYP